MDTTRACVLALVVVILAIVVAPAPTDEQPPAGDEKTAQVQQLDGARDARATARAGTGSKPSPAMDLAGALTGALSGILLRGAAGAAAGGGVADTAGLPALVARNYKKMAQTILPLLVGFKATGLLVIAMAVTKFVLLKALFLSTTALFVAALVALKKFLSSGQPHDIPAVYTYQHQDLSHVPYLHHAGAEYMDAASQMAVPQVTYIGGSYGLQSVPYAATAGAALGAAGLGATGQDDAQGLYSAHHNSVAALSQLQQLQQLQQQALLAGNATQQAGHHMLRRRLSAPHGATALSLHRPTRTEARPV
ncbi:uncharacterized protein LOC113217558 isoform X2 [Frankliniella occidentalis]|uniref:Uncharacterized protein LOC113217558 isoform X2 n=1 Tax=Frankliniella occidentalis TaxID=133901 RepID=A0A9C6U3U3_FRAOC|nr:uncharacterized protein LOC113217558 isoform X2 [Frankliniella occidentalis]